MPPRNWVLALAILLTPTSFIGAVSASQVDINHATLDELMRLPGMTQVWAQRVIRFRPYKTKLDLLNQGIVSAPVYYKVRDSIIAHRDSH